MTNTIRKLVKCPKCGEIKVTYAKRYFFCCRMQHPIEPNLINSDGTKPINQTNDTLMQNQEADSSGENLNETPANAVEQDLEIEGDEPENPLENLEEEKKEFHCPHCNNKLNEYETPCPKCFYDIEWQ